MIEVLRLLHELDQENTRHSTTYYVRHLDRSEELPQFGHGFPDSPLMQKDWIWIAYSNRDDTPLAIIIAAPTQGVAMLLRAYAIPDAPITVFVGLLRKSLADIYSRGYTKYALYLSTSRPEEAKLARLVRRSGGAEMGSAISLFMGNTDIGKW